MAISESDPQQKKFKKGDFIGTQYEVLDVLGEGGFGIVYLVNSRRPKGTYALKTFRDEYLEDIRTRERFLKEALVWINLERHPYIVRSYFVHELSGRLFIAMEHIASDEPGMNTLEGYLRRKPPNLIQSLKWAIQFCLGMEHAYSKGVKAHRDIKPANIMIDQNKTIRITDFGLAGVLPQSSIVEQCSSHGKVGNDTSMQTAIGTGSIGTPEYMSPEQFSDFSECDERSDIYSFGIVLYRMASGGRLPFITDNPAYRWEALKHFHQETPVPELKSLLFPVILRCLEKHPGERYQAFRELRTALEPFLKRETGEVPVPLGNKELDAREWIYKGYSFFNLAKYQEAIVCSDKALEINPSDADPWHVKGIALASLGELQEAMICYDKALEINPRYEDVWCSKGVELLWRRDYQEAMICYNKALEINPIYAYAWHGKGDILASLGELQEAIGCYDKALEINPRYEDAWCGKADVLANLDNYQEAIGCYDKALEIDPIDGAALYGKADVLSNQGNIFASLDQYKEALVCFDKALELNPEDEDVWYRKGYAQDKLNRSQVAIISYNKFLRLASADHHDIIDARKRIKVLEGK